MIEDKLQRDRALQDLEEALPPMKVEKLKRAASSYKANSCSGRLSHQSVAASRHGNVIKMVIFSAKVEHCGEWPVQASTLVFFLIPKKLSSERPIASLPTLIQWWERWRASVVQDNQERGWVFEPHTRGKTLELSVLLQV